MELKNEKQKTQLKKNKDTNTQKKTKIRQPWKRSLKMKQTFRGSSGGGNNERWRWRRRCSGGSGLCSEWR